MKTANFLFAAFCAMILPFTRSELKPFEKTFTIDRGEHYATPRAFKVFKGDTLRFNAKFNESAIYDLGNNTDQYDLNKLSGFTDCDSVVHENSARFTWRWLNNRLEVLPYTYANGTRYIPAQEIPLAIVDLNKTYQYEIKTIKDHYSFKITSPTGEVVVAEQPRGCDKDKTIKTLLFPYFGGNATAPHAVKIDLSVSP
jgi:hypothetical protein